MSKKLRKGDRIIHQSLDSKKGFAKTGTASDIIEEEDQTIVAGSWDDEEKKVAFDDREISRLVPFSDASPVILKPRHFKALLRERETRAALLFVLLVSILLLILLVLLELEPVFILGFVSVFIGLSLLLFNRLEAARERADRKSN